MSKAKRKVARKTTPLIAVKKATLGDLHDMVFQFFQHLNRITLEQERIGMQLMLLTNSVIRRDNQLDRMIAIQRLGLKRLERFYSSKVEPSLIASIRKDLKTPTLSAVPNVNFCPVCGDASKGHTIDCTNGKNGDTKC